MKIERLVGGELRANGYIVYDEGSSLAFIVDPGYDSASFVDKLKELKLEAKGILLTHHHYDHVDAALELKKALEQPATLDQEQPATLDQEQTKQAGKLPIYIHEDDGLVLKFKADVLMKDGDEISFGNSKLTLVNTPGHTRGSSCYLNFDQKIALTGDTIFNVDLGRTDLSDGSPEEMRASIKNIISKWGDGWTIYPGHGDPATMEYVRKHNLEYLEIMK